MTTTPLLGGRQLPAGLEGLWDLALDLRWTGSQPSDVLWSTIDPEAWERTTNPYLILQNATQERLEAAAANEALLAELHAALAKRSQLLTGPTWFERHGHADRVDGVAYFSMEFGLSESLPVYSGGLGVLAGDFLKTASDMGVPVVGVGLLYQQGYFRQSLARDGMQLEAFPFNDPVSLPILPAQASDGGWLRVNLNLPGRTVSLRVWRARVGRVDLLLLDSNDPLNGPWDRGITSALYVAQPERRLLQEIALGFGGWQVLEALGIEPEICHLNEGHAAFAVLARARTFMTRNGCTFREALRATRMGNVFTTHTPVAAGFDRFHPSLMQQYAQHFAEMVGVSVDEVMDLGRAHPGDQNELLTMAHLAIKGSGYVNGVSALHGDVSRRLFLGLFPGRPQNEIPVDHVTNGIHVPTWDTEEAHGLWQRVCEHADWLEEGEPAPLTPDRVSDLELWELRASARKSLVEYIRRRLERQERRRSAPADVVSRAAHILDPNALTIGFARRFATYKRPGLLLSDPDRLRRILCRADRPVQIIVAGKAHPEDMEAKRIVQMIANFAEREDVFDRVVFLEDYDMALTQRLAGGVDVWLNLPRRPMEACGTSGMKMLVNGGLNLSVLDGWWAEAYRPEVGWSLGDGREDGSPARDADEARQLYDLLEHSIVPEFYGRDEAGVPVRWIERVRASMCGLTAQFSSYRMMRDYIEKAYLPAAARLRERTAGGGALALELQRWSEALETDWKSVRVGAQRVQECDGKRSVSVHVYFGDLDPASARVELYADAADGWGVEVIPLERVRPIAGASNGHVFEVCLESDRPDAHYTARVVPYHPAACLPLEDSHILWRA